MPNGRIVEIAGAAHGGFLTHCDDVSKAIIGFWALAVLSLVTFGQRVDAVRRAAAGRPASPVPAGDSWRDDGGEPPDEARTGAPS